MREHMSLIRGLQAVAEQMKTLIQELRLNAKNSMEVKGVED